MRDAKDRKTLDLVEPELTVARGQVLMDHQRRFALVARKSQKHAHLVQVQAGTLKLSKITAKQLVADWIDADYPFESAVTKLLDLGKRHGITESARVALESLRTNGRDPVQYDLFS